MDRSTIAEWILQYLAQHPTARDSARGVVSWCFAISDVSPPEALVQNVLDKLVRDKRIGSSVLIDGTRIYHRL
jgi:hypothetical protein